MNWLNSKQTFGINLKRVSYWTWKPDEQTIELHFTDLNGVNGSPIVISGYEGKEIYKILLSKYSDNKTVIFD